MYSENQTVVPEMEVSNNMPKAIDWELSLKLSNNNPALAKEMLAMFVAELPDTLSHIQQAYQQQDFEQLHARVHKLHGATCYCGVPNLKQVVLNLETAIKRKDTSSLGKLINKMEQEITAVLSTYQADSFDK